MFKQEGTDRNDGAGGWDRMRGQTGRGRAGLRGTGEQALLWAATEQLVLRGRHNRAQQAPPWQSKRSKSVWTKGTAVTEHNGTQYNCSEETEKQKTNNTELLGDAGI